MKGSRKFLMHYNSTVGQNLGIKSMACRVLAVNDGPSLPISCGHEKFVDFISAYLFDYDVAGDAAAELLNCEFELVNDVRRRIGTGVVRAVAHFYQRWN